MVSVPYYYGVHVNKDNFGTISCWAVLSQSESSNILTRHMDSWEILCMARSVVARY